jgi:hypothetical protein
MKLPFEVDGSMELKDTQAFFLRMVMRLIKYLGPLLFTFTILNAYFSMTTGQNIVAILSWFIFPIVFTSGIGIMSLIIGFVMHKKKKERFESIHYTFTESDLQTKAFGFESKLAWSNFSKIKESSKYVLIYQGKMLTNLIPKRHFREESEIKELVAFVQERSLYFLNVP